MTFRRYTFFLILVCALAAGWNISGVAQNETNAPPAPSREYSRPRYGLRLNVDYQLLTFSASGEISIPVARGESLSDAVFFIYANAPGVSGNDAAHSNVVVDEVKLGGTKAEYSQLGAVLRVKLPAPQTGNFTLKMKWRGVVPRSPEGSGGLMDAMGGMDLSSIFGGGATNQPKKEPDYGVYSYGNGVLSLGSFWYPSLAVRQNGKWMDEAPGGVGDVGFSEASDFSVHAQSAKGVAFVATGTDATALMDARQTPNIEQHLFTANSTRDFSILASEQFVTKQKQIEAAGRKITVSAYVTKKHEAKADEVLDIAANALQIYSKRFGAYPYSQFKVVEGPMRGGAGGMEFSGVVSIASFLFDDMDKQMQELGASLGVGDIEKTMAQLFPENAEENNANANANPATEMLGGLLGGQKAILDSLLEQTVAHETAHQWWAMAVGSDAQRAPWLDESLTNYSSVVYFEDRYGKEKAAQMMDLHLKGTYSTGRMMGGADAAVNLGSADYANNLQYGAVVYGKGALYYDALRKLVGDENFFVALRAYYQKYNGQIAPSRGLLEMMKAQAPGKANEIEKLFHRWIEETHGDEDIAGGKIGGVQDLLGGLLGGMAGGMEQ